MKNKTMLNRSNDLTYYTERRMTNTSNFLQSIFVFEKHEYVKNTITIDEKN